MANDGKITKDDLLESGAENVYSELATKATKAIKDIAKELQNLDKTQRKVGITASELTKIRNSQNAELKKLQVEEKKLSVSHKKRINALKEETAAIKKETAASIQSNREKKKSVSANKTLTGTFQKLLKSMVAFIGVRMFIQGVKDVFNLIKQLDSLNLTLKAVTSNLSELMQTQAFLTKISFKYGVNLIATTNRYSKFLAAAKQSNLALKETESIYETVTKASGILGLKTDELAGIYLALEQMLSKGKVTTEELRRQLGERLPGAFGIMADALGVTTAKLDEMLKKGEVISAEALPKFVEALKETEYMKSVEGNINTLVAAQNRLSNAWTTFVSNLENGNGVLSKTSKFVLDLGSAVISTFDDVSLASDGILDFFSNLYLSTTPFGQIQVQTKALIKKSIKERKILEKELTDIIIKEDKKRGRASTQTAWSLDEINRLTTEEIKERIDLYQKEINTLKIKNKLIDKLIVDYPILKQIDLEKKSYKELLEIEKTYFQKTIAGKREKIKEEKAFLETLKDGEKVQAKIVQNRIKILEKEIEDILGSNKKKKESDDLTRKIKQNVLKEQIEANKLILADDEATYLKKVEALNKIADKEKEINRLIFLDKKDKIEKELISDKEKTDKLTIASQELASKTISIETNKQKSIQGLKDKEVASVKELVDEEKRILEIAFNKEMALLQKRNLSKEEFDKQAKDITFKYKKLELDAIIKVTKAQIKSLEALGITGEKLEKLKKQLEVLESIDIGESIGGEKGLSTIEKYQEALQALGSVLDSIAEITQNAHEANIIALEREMDALEESYDRRKELEGDDADAKKALDKELAAEKKKIELKIKKEKEEQFKANKKADLAQAAINIALGITRAIADGNFFTIPLIAAAGALQIAAIESTPIPKFADGGVMPHTGKALINDGGSREFVERGGQIFSSPIKDAVVDLQQGDIIHKDLNALMNASIMTSLANDNKNLDTSKLKLIFDSNYSGLESAIKNGFKGVKNNIKITQQKVDIPHALYSQGHKKW